MVHNVYTYDESRPYLGHSNVHTTFIRAPPSIPSLALWCAGRFSLLCPGSWCTSSGGYKVLVEVMVVVVTMECGGRVIDYH